MLLETGRLVLWCSFRPSFFTFGGIGAALFASVAQMMCPMSLLTGVFGRKNLVRLLCGKAPGRGFVTPWPAFQQIPPLTGILWVRQGVHYYKNFTGGRRFRFSAAGKAVRRGLEATVNRGLNAAGGLARCG